MNTKVMRVTGLAWLCAGLLLVWMATDQISKNQILAGLLEECFGLVGSLAGYAAFRHRSWAVWLVGVLALLLGTLGAGYFFKYGLGWTQGSGDWAALVIVCFSALTLAAVAREKLGGSPKPTDEPN